MLSELRSHIYILVCKNSGIPSRQLRGKVWVWSWMWILQIRTSLDQLNDRPCQHLAFKSYLMWDAWERGGAQVSALKEFVSVIGNKHLAGSSLWMVPWDGAEFFCLGCNGLRIKCLYFISAWGSPSAAMVLDGKKKSQGCYEPRVLLPILERNEYLPLPLFYILLSLPPSISLG